MRIRVVLDTNIILSSISNKSPYHLILKYLIDGVYDLYVTSDILLEYEEKISSNFNSKLAHTFIAALLTNKNVKRIELFFYLNLIDVDKDDNKFVDCAFASNVHFLVTNDKHFNILKNISFPMINITDIDGFKSFLLSTV